MIRPFVLGLIALSLSACGLRSTRPATEYKPAPADVPDAALVAPCDTSEQPVKVNGDLTDELTRTRSQRDECAGRMDGVRQWRDDAIKRAEVPLPKGN